MKNQITTTAVKSDTLLSLQHVVSNLVNSFLPAAKRNQTELVNEVRQEIALGANDSRVIGIMKELLETVVSNSNHGEIHITAERFKDTILFEIQERNNNNGYALAYRIESIERSAHSTGGHVSINGPQKRVATISFTFPDQLIA